MYSLKATRVFLALSIAVFIFYLTSRFIVKDVYSSAFVGAMFELLFFPMLLLLFGLPVVIAIALFRGPAQTRVISVIALLVLIGAAMVLFL